MIEIAIAVGITAFILWGGLKITTCKKCGAGKAACKCQEPK